MTNGGTNRLAERLLYQIERIASRYNGRTEERKAKLAEIDLIRSGRVDEARGDLIDDPVRICLLYTSPSPRD